MGRDVYMKEARTGKEAKEGKRKGMYTSEGGTRGKENYEITGIIA